MEYMEYLERDNRIQLEMLCSRNELINRLLEELPQDEKQFKKAIEMRRENWEYDRKILAKYPLEKGKD